MMVSQYASWLVFGFFFGACVWGACYVVQVLRHTLAVGAGFYDV